MNTWYAKKTYIKNSVTCSILFKTRPNTFFITLIHNMTILVQNNSTSEDHTCQAMPIFKKLWSTASTSLANGKSHYFKNIPFSVNAYRRDKKHNERSSRHKHRSKDRWKRWVVIIIIYDQLIYIKDTNGKMLSCQKTLIEMRLPIKVR